MSRRLKKIVILDEDESDENNNNINNKSDNNVQVITNKTNKLAIDDDDDLFGDEEEIKPALQSKSRLKKGIANLDDEEDNQNKEKIELVKTTSKSKTSKPIIDESEKEEEVQHDSEDSEQEAVTSIKTRSSSIPSRSKKPTPPTKNLILENLKSKKKLLRDDTSEEEEEEEEQEEEEEDDDESEEDAQDEDYNKDSDDDSFIIERTKTPIKRSNKPKLQKKNVFEDFNEKKEDNSSISSKDTIDLEKLVDQLNGFVKDEEKNIYLNSRSTKEGKYLKMESKTYDQLFWYQRDGVNWLWNLFVKHSGGILGDDMGLGKTMQICTFLHCMHSQKHIKHSLLVMPVALIEHWLKEFARFNPRYLVKVFHGSNTKERENSLLEVKHQGGVIITTYGMVIPNLKLMSNHLNKPFVWDYIILDEGHKIKETKTQISKTMREFKANHKIIMTGTAIQNNLRELWALFDWVCDGTLLGSVRDFTSRFEKPILKSHTVDSSQDQKVLGSAIAQNLRDIIAPHFLRREKKDVFKNGEEETTSQQSSSASSQNKSEDNQLEEEEEVTDENGKTKKRITIKLTPTKIKGTTISPLKLTPSKSLAKKRMSIGVTGGIKARKNDFVVWCKLAENQIRLYQMFLESDEVKLALNKTTSPLAALTVLKKICDHPHLLNEEMKTLSGEGDMKKFLSEITENLSLKTLVLNSGKFQLLLKLLPNLRNEGHRCLMFSQSVKMLDDFESVLEYLGLKYLRIDGSISSTKKRQEIIDLYNTDHSYFAFIMTIQVGALGLNLTSADRVLIFDPSWNTIDNQAVDRAYRIGQKRNVVVYRLITCGTIEEKIYRKQVFKGSLMKTMLNNQTEGQHRYFSSNELRELFTLDDTNTSTTQKQLEELHSKNRKSSPDLDEHLNFINGLKMVFGVSDHDLLFTETVHTDHNEEHLEQVKQSLSQGRKAKFTPTKRANKKKAITYVRDTPNKTQVRSKQYVHISEDYGHEEEDLEEVDFESHFGTNISNVQPWFLNDHQYSTSIMSPVAKPTKKYLSEINLGSKRNRNEQIEIIDDEDEEQDDEDDSEEDEDDNNSNNNINSNSNINSNKITTTKTSDQPVYVNLDSDNDDDEKIIIDLEDNFKQAQLIDEYNEMLEEANKFNSTNPTKSINMFLDAQNFAQENNLPISIDNQDSLEYAIASFHKLAKPKYINDNN